MPAPHRLGPFRVSFVPPPDFIDWTQYAYTDPNGREYVKVGYGYIPNTAQTARDVLTERAGELEDLREYDPALAIEPVSGTPIGPLPGAVLSFTAHEQHYQFREWWAITLLDDVSYVQLVYHAPASDPASPSRLKQILASVAPVDVSPRTAGAGFAHRQAGRISLDVPKRLALPAAFSFASDDGAVHLFLEIHERPVAWTPPPGAVIERTAEALPVEDLTAMIVRLLVVREMGGQNQRWAYRQGSLSFDDGVSVHLAGDAPEPYTTLLDAAVRSVLSSVRQDDEAEE